MKILLIEDNEEIANGLSYTFKENDYEFYHVNSLYKAKNIINKIDFNLIILDVTLSDGNGFDFYKENLNLKNIPVIFLTAKDSEDDIVKGFELGCDDYITKPFMTRELLARVARLLSNKKNVINVKDITFDSDKMEVKKNGNIINLTSLELKILYLFMTNIGKVITRESLINYIYNLTGNDVNDNTITVYLKRIREKIGDNIIETKKGIGYIINEK